MKYPYRIRSIHNKYHAEKSGGYDSRKEHRRANELRLMQRAGLISNLREQVKYELIPTQRDADGKLIGMGIGKSSCLIKEIRDCVTRADIPLEVAIKGITSNPARILCLKNKGRIEEGKDADICIMTKDLQIDTVIAMGKVMVRHGDMVVKGYFE